MAKFCQIWSRCSLLRNIPSCLWSLWRITNSFEYLNNLVLKICTVRRLHLKISNNLFSNGQFSANSFLYFRLFNTVGKCSIIFLPISGIEPYSSGFGNDHYTNWATTTAPLTNFFQANRRETGSGEAGTGGVSGNPRPETKLVGILKPPTPSPKLRSFPSLPESFIAKLNIGISPESHQWVILFFNLTNVASFTSFSQHLQRRPFVIWTCTGDVEGIHVDH